MGNGLSKSWGESGNVLGVSGQGRCPSFKVQVMEANAFKMSLFPTLGWSGRSPHTSNQCCWLSVPGRFSDKKHILTLIVLSGYS